MKEQWKDFKGFSNYIISNRGRLKNKKTNTFVKPVKNNNGYYQFIFASNKNQQGKHILVHRAVAEHFINNIENKKYVSFKEKNRIKWCAYNIKWSDNATCSKSVIQYDLKGNKLNEFGSMRDASKMIKRAYVGISDCCRNVRSAKTCGGYRWEYKHKQKKRRK